jgi:hypothetical protein
MKIASYILTILFQFLLVFVLKFLDNFVLLIFLYLAMLATGLILKFKTEEETTANEIGRGIFNASLTVIIVMILFFLWLSANFPR